MECCMPQSPSSNPQTQNLLQNSTNHIKQKAMETFQKAIFKLVETQPGTPLTPVGRTFLQDHLNQFVSRYKTPDHPPYSAMIEKALRELNEKRGSSEDSISQLIKKDYENLPWSHSALLNHHLSKLCDSGDIIATRNNKYMLPRQNPNPKSTTKVKRKPQRRRVKWDWERDRNKRRKRSKKGKGGKVGVSAKHQESNKEEEQKGGVSAKHQESNQEEEQKIGVSAKHQESNQEEEQKVGVSAKHQESNEEKEQKVGVSAKYQESNEEKAQKVGVSAKRQESNEEEEQKITENCTLIPHDAEENNLSSPERPSGFEFDRVDNLSPNLDKVEVEIVSGEEFSKSERDLRQKRRWMWKFPVKFENRPKLEGKKDLPFSEERNPQRKQRGGPNFESFLDLLGPEYDLPKRANKKLKPTKPEYTNESNHEVEEKQVRKRGRPWGWRKRILEQEPDATEVENDEESRQNCSSPCEKTETPERPQTRQIGRSPKRRSLRLQKLE